MSQRKKAGVAAPATNTWCLIVSASRGIRAPASFPKSMAKTVARCRFEGTSIIAKCWYEADVSEGRCEERAGWSNRRGDGLRSLRSRLARRQDTRLRSICMLTLAYLRERCYPLLIIVSDNGGFHTSSSDMDLRDLPNVKNGNIRWPINATHVFRKQPSDTIKSSALFHYCELGVASDCGTPGSRFQLLKPPTQFSLSLITHNVSRCGHSSRPVNFGISS